MHTVTVAQAKSHFSKILNWVEAGEEVVVTRRGRPIACIGAVAKKLKPIPSLAAFRAQLPKAKVSSAKEIRKLRDEGY